jgi:dihydrofolate reductase
MKLIVHEFLSLDGVMQGPGGEEEDRQNDFTRGGWIVPFASAPGWGEVVSGWFERADALLLGRSTYDMMYPYWSQVTDPDNTVGAALNNLRKYVVSTSLTAPEWANTTQVDGDLVEQVSALKRSGDGELQVHGSWRLARSLHDAGLVDEYRLLIFPVCVGDGKRLFPEHGRATGFEVARSEIVDGGTTYLELRPRPYATGGLDVVDGKEVLLDA